MTSDLKCPLAIDNQFVRCWTRRKIHVSSFLMTDTAWTEKLNQVFQRGIRAWKAGKRNPASMFDPDDQAFLAGIGCTTQEMFDFVDDHLDWGEPSFETVHAIQQVRQEFFLKEMRGQTSGKIASMSDLPSKSQAIDGFVWLPRMMAKARLKLRGEMPDDLMYGCGGDRAFCEREKVDLAKFLKLVWESGDNDQLIVAAVKSRSVR